MAGFVQMMPNFLWPPCMLQQICLWRFKVLGMETRDDGRHNQTQSQAHDNPIPIYHHVSDMHGILTLKKK